MWLTNKKQVLIIVARHLGVAALAVILALIMVTLASRAIVKIGDSLYQKEKLSKLLSIRANNMQQLKKSLEQIGGNGEKMYKIYPPADNILEFVGALESLASQNSLKQTLSFSQFLPDTDASAIARGKINYTINLNGTIFTLKAYLQQLEKLPFATKLGALNLLASPAHGWEGDSTITLNGTLYVK
jgi:hypothetical protein